MKILFKTITGSRLYGIANEDSDTDMKGFGVPNLNYILGLMDMEQKECSNGLEGRDKIETVIYTVKKYFKLCIKGNPTVLELAFAERVPGMIVNNSMVAHVINDFIREHCIVKSHFNAYYGYFQSQVKKLKEKKYDQNSNRIALIEKYGYDTKFAAHAYRLGAQCCQLLMDKDNFTPRLSGQILETTLDIRNGNMNLKSVLMYLELMDGFLLSSKESSKLPDEVDMEKVNVFFTNFMLDYILENYE